MYTEPPALHHINAVIRVADFEEERTGGYEARLHVATQFQEDGLLEVSKHPGVMNRMGWLYENVNEIEWLLQNVITDAGSQKRLDLFIQIIL